MQLAELCADPVVLSCAFLCLLPSARSRSSARPRTPGSPVRPHHVPQDGRGRRGGGVVPRRGAHVPQGAGRAVRQPACRGQRRGHHVRVPEHGVRQLRAQVEADAEAGQRAPARARALADWACVRRDEAGHLLRGVAEAAAAGRPVVVPEVLVCALANIVGQITVSRRVFDAQGDESSSYKDMIVSLLTPVQHQRLRAGAGAAGPAGRAGEAAAGPPPVRRPHRQAAGGARGDGRRPRAPGPPGLRRQAPRQHGRRRRRRERRDHHRGQHQGPHLRKLPRSLPPSSAFSYMLTSFSFHCLLTTCY
ncbi:hypothetical protein C2845_PM01G16090 [Panicum miliaceum]|uniref:Uncharacterized protein n=1 Tax=Panicum miliaceum TaxID=4540 RepID=A0A3L6TPG9_PANMI|nr:hypothetical protein C2845_PM01G16090 [Panicum miliaceum]